MGQIALNSGLIREIEDDSVIETLAQTLKTPVWTDYGVENPVNLVLELDEAV